MLVFPALLTLFSLIILFSLKASAQTYEKISYERSISTIGGPSSSACNFAGSIRIASPKTLTTQGSFYSLATQNLNAIQLTADYINVELCGVKVGGQNYSLVIETVDDSSDAATVKAISKSWAGRGLQTNQSIDFVIGPYSSGLTAAMMTQLNDSSIFADQTIPILAPGSASTASVYSKYGGDANGKRIFGTLAPGSTYARSSIESLQAAGAKSIAWLSDPRGFTTGICNGVGGVMEEGHAKDYGIEVVNATTLTTRSPSVEELKSIFSFWRDEIKPDVVLGCVYANECSSIINALKELQYAPKAVLMTTCVGLEDLVTQHGDDLMYYMGPSVWHKSVTGQTDAKTGWSAMDFHTRFTDTFGFPPVYQGASAGASVSVLVQAIERADTLTDTTKILAELDADASSPFLTFFSDVSFDSLGQAQIPNLPLQYQPGTEGEPSVSIVFKDSSPGIVYPIPSWSFRACIKGNNCSSRGTCRFDGTCDCDEGYTAFKDECGVVQLNLIPTSTRTLCDTMAALNIVVAICFCAWAWVHRRTKIVLHAQPSFLMLISLGSVISSSTIFFLGRDETDSGGDGAVVGTLADGPRNSNADRNCMVSVWLYCLGFICTFAPLFGKLWRVQYIWTKSSKLSATKVSDSFLARVVFGFIFVDFVALLVWSVKNPLVYARTAITTEVSGFVLSSYGVCESESVWGYVTVIAVYHVSVLMWGVYLAYKSRNLPTTFNESKFVGMAMVGNFQVLVLGIPILVIVAGNPLSSFFVESGIIFLNDFTTQCFIFLPKILSTHFPAQFELKTLPSVNAKSKSSNRDITSSRFESETASKVVSSMQGSHASLKAEGVAAEGQKTPAGVEMAGESSSKGMELGVDMTPNPLHITPSTTSSASANA